jgi:hypothetical protein
MKPSLPPLRSLLTSLCLVAVTGLGLLAAEIDDKATAFIKLANGVIEQAVVGKLDVPAVSKDLLAMEDISAWFAGQYKAKYPIGIKLMDFMLSKKDSLNQMTLADIDAQFESEAISKAHGKELVLDLTIEENEHFGNPIDMFVHPATAYICAQMWDKEHKAEQLKRIQSELQEVIEHCHKVMEKLK